MKSAIIFAFVVFGAVNAIYIHQPHYVYRPHRPRPKPTTTTTTTTPEPTTTAAFEPGFTCEGKADGVYDMGCSAEFASCSNGVASFHTCRDGHVFDSVTGRCLRSEYVTACGGIPTETPSRPTTTTTTTPPPTAAAPPETTTLPEITTTEYRHPCRDRPSGVYGFGCSSDYVYCSHGHETHMHCQPPFRFNPWTLKCAPQGLVPSCRQGYHHGYHGMHHPSIQIGEAF